MLKKLLRYIRGYVKIQISGNSPERFLNLCRHHEIQIWGLYPNGQTYEMYMSIQSYKKLRVISRKTHTKVKILEKRGLMLFFFHYRKRKLFFAGAVLSLLLILQYSNIIWDIHFIGNEKWTDQVLLEYLEQLDVEPGMQKSKVDCAKIAAEMRKEYQDIIWVSVSIDGSCLKIKIKENEDVFLLEETNGISESVRAQAQIKDSPQDLIAVQDGVITDMITRKGTPLVQVGDEVKKGEILVSGRIEVKDDSAQVIAYQYCQADADIYADTEEYYKKRINRVYKEKVYLEKQERRKWYISICGYRFWVGTNQNDSKAKKEVYSLERQLKFGENFYLPFRYGKIILKMYKEIEKKYTNEEIQTLLSYDFSLFLQELEKKGVQMQENSVRIRCYENYASAEGTLYLNQKITETADTEILEIERNEINESSGTVN